MAFNEAYKMSKEMPRVSYVPRTPNSNISNTNNVSTASNMSNYNRAVATAKRVRAKRAENLEKKVKNVLLGMGINGRNDRIGILRWMREVGTNPIREAENRAKHILQSEFNYRQQGRREQAIRERGLSTNSGFFSGIKSLFTRNQKAGKRQRKTRRRTTS